MGTIQRNQITCQYTFYLLYLLLDFLPVKPNQPVGGKHLHQTKKGYGMADPVHETTVCIVQAFLDYKVKQR